MYTLITNIPVCYRLSPADLSNGLNVWPLILHVSNDNFEEFPSVKELDKQVVGESFLHE